MRFYTAKGKVETFSFLGNELAEKEVIFNQEKASAPHTPLKTHSLPQKKSEPRSDFLGLFEKQRAKEEIYSSKTLQPKQRVGKNSFSYGNRETHFVHIY
jgi:hypothetical protein